MPNLISDEDIAAAEEELKSKSPEDIERDTALKWGARYLAAKSNNHPEAETYYHEAIEHAASTEDVEFYSQILEELKSTKVSAGLRRLASEIENETGVS